MPHCSFANTDSQLRANSINSTSQFANYVGNLVGDPCSLWLLLRVTNYPTICFVVQPLSFISRFISPSVFTLALFDTHVIFTFIFGTTRPGENTSLQWGFTGSITAITLDFLSKMTHIRGETSILTKRVFELFKVIDEISIKFNRDFKALLGDGEDFV